MCFLYYSNSCMFINFNLPIRRNDWQEFLGYILCLLSGWRLLSKLNLQDWHSSHLWVGIRVLLLYWIILFYFSFSSLVMKAQNSDMCWIWANLIYMLVFTGSGFQFLHYERSKLKYVLKLVFRLKKWHGRYDHFERHCTSSSEQCKRAVHTFG